MSPEISWHESANRPKRLLKAAEAYRRIAISKSEGERRVVDDPNFPKKIRLGTGERSRSIAFLESEVDAYIDHLIAASRSPTPRPAGKLQQEAPQTRPSGKPEPAAPYNSGAASGEPS